MKELIVKNDLMHHLNNVVDQSLPKGEITLEQSKYILSLLSNKESEEEKEDKAVDFYLWMNTNNYDHNIRQRVEKKYEIFKRNGAI